MADAATPECPNCRRLVGIIERQNPARPAETVAVPIRYAIELLDRFREQWYAVAK